MNKNQVRTPGQALAYITDCNLATVCDMAMLKSRKKHEFERQIAIAQTAIDWMRDFGIDMSTTRAAQIVANGQTVKEWAGQFMRKSEDRG